MHVSKWHPFTTSWQIDVGRKGTQRPASSYAVPVRSVTATSRPVSRVVSSMSLCSTGHGGTAATRIRAHVAILPNILCIQDLQEKVFFYLQQNMGNVPTVSLCALTILINVRVLHMALFNTFDIHTGTKMAAVSNFLAHLLKLTKKTRHSDINKSIPTLILPTKRTVNPICGKKAIYLSSFQF